MLVYIVCWTLVCCMYVTTCACVFVGSSGELATALLQMYSLNVCVCVCGRHLHHGRLWPTFLAAGLFSSQMRPFCNILHWEKRHSGNIRVSDLPSFHRPFLRLSWIDISSFFMVLACSLICTASIKLIAIVLLKSDKNAARYPLLIPHRIRTYLFRKLIILTHRRGHSRSALFSDLIGVASPLS